MPTLALRSSSKQTADRIDFAVTDCHALELTSGPRIEPPGRSLVRRVGALHRCFTTGFKTILRTGLALGAASLLTLAALASSPLADAHASAASASAAPLPRDTVPREALPREALPRVVTPKAPEPQAAARPNLPPTAASLTEPHWASLSVGEQTALRPLFAGWASMPTAQKRKWLQLSKGYPQLSAADQTKLHARMSAWSGLSPQQRAQARLSFADASGQMSADERKAKWQAYQALSPEERQRLRLVGKGEQTKGAALAAKPVAPDRLATVPKQSLSPSPHNPKASGVARSPGKASAKIALSSSPEVSRTR